MKISLGTKSPNKLSYVENILEKLQILDYKIESLNVQSQVSEQPLSEMTTITGAINRAYAAHEQSPQDETIAIGLEGGLEFIDRTGECNYFCVASAYYNHHFYTSISHRLKVPNEVAKAVKSGKQLADEIRAYKPTNLEEAQQVERIISRKYMFEDAIKDLFLKTVAK